MKKSKTNTKKRVIVFSVLAGLLIVGGVLFCLFGLPYIRRHYQTVHVNRAEAARMDPVDMGNRNGLIVYFTRVGNTDFEPDVDAVSSASLMEDNGTLIGNAQLLSEMIANATGFDTYAIKVKDLYSSSYDDTVSEANEENKSGTIRELDGELPDLEAYDSIFLVYPLWWWTLPQPVKTFLTETDLTGKTLYSVVTHGGSKFGHAAEDTAELTAATISSNALEGYDDDVTKAAPKVTAWLKGL